MASALDHYDYDRLPDSVHALIEVIGIQAALRLIEAFGGTDVYVPRRPTPELESLLGLGPAQALVDHYYAGSDKLKLPRCAAAMRSLLHRRIVAAYHDGASAAELARGHGCTERWVYILVARARDEASAARPSCSDRLNRFS
ncbi:Mor transcription activator family protein [Salinisphaera orenii]|uniref:Mor transcription activator family protein n=1 Tax=Salinisphaera orenii TaxID=856731 RepID=UPI000DBE4051